MSKRTQVVSSAPVGKPGAAEVSEFRAGFGVPQSIGKIVYESQTHVADRHQCEGQ